MQLHRIPRRPEISGDPIRQGPTLLFEDELGRTLINFDYIYPEGANYSNYYRAEYRHIEPDGSNSRVMPFSDLVKDSLPFKLNCEVEALGFNFTGQVAHIEVNLEKLKAIGRPSFLLFAHALMRNSQASWIDALVDSINNSRSTNPELKSFLDANSWAQIYVRVFTQLTESYPKIKNYLKTAEPHPLGKAFQTKENGQFKLKETSPVAFHLLNMVAEAHAWQAAITLQVQGKFCTGLTRSGAIEFAKDRLSGSQDKSMVKIYLKAFAASCDESVD